MTNLEKLVADHAYWSDKRKELKRLGTVEIAKCNGSQRVLVTQSDQHKFLTPVEFEPYYTGENCIEYAYSVVRNEYIEPDCYEYDIGISYEEIWNGNHEDANGNPWEPCEHCKKVRELKKERGKAGMRLGQIRGTMTRIGRNIQGSCE